MKVRVSEVYEHLRNNYQRGSLIMKSLRCEQDERLSGFTVKTYATRKKIVKHQRTWLPPTKQSGLPTSMSFSFVFDEVDTTSSTFHLSRSSNCPGDLKPPLYRWGMRDLDRVSQTDPICTFLFKDAQLLRRSLTAENSECNVYLFPRHAV